MTEIDSPRILAEPLKKVKVAGIDNELNVLWAKLNRKSDGGQTVMRACMSNLIIYCDTPEEAALVSQEITPIVDVHPARVLLLIGNGQPDDNTLAVKVCIYYAPLENSWQVCAERIDVVATTATATRLPFVARAHLVGDLPTTLWWVSKQPPPEAGQVFFQLAELSNQIIYDNTGWIKPEHGVSMMSRWVAAQQDDIVVYNLAWRRCAIWRKLLAQALDPKVRPGALEGLQQIEIHHGPHSLPLTWLLVSWLANQLHWQVVDGKRVSNSELFWRFRINQQELKVKAKRLPEGEPEVYRLTLNWQLGSQKSGLCFERLDNSQISITDTQANTPAQVFVAHMPNRADMISAQLAHRGRDKLFENAAKLANAMTAVFQS
jgi:glucose-6-phosphate dehydrogenase assembly protein OpcA